LSVHEDGAIITLAQCAAVIIPSPTTDAAQVMSNTNNNADRDHSALAMLCGVVPPEYREGMGNPFAALVKQAERAMGFPLDDEPEPAPASVPRLSPPRP
jgi:hypothetical protein